MTPRYFCPGATAWAIEESCFQGRRTMGLSGDRRSFSSSGFRWQCSLAQERSGSMTAKGLSGRCFLQRSASTAPESWALQARRKPPRPLMARIFPSFRSRIAEAIGSDAGIGFPSGSTSWSWGPQTGQALGWAWNLRSPGSSYSLRQSGHMRKGAMVVLGRS